MRRVTHARPTLYLRIARETQNRPIPLCITHAAGSTLHPASRICLALRHAFWYTQAPRCNSARSRNPTRVGPPRHNALRILANGSAQQILHLSHSSPARTTRAIRASHFATLQHARKRNRWPAITVERALHQPLCATHLASVSLCHTDCTRTRKSALPLEGFATSRATTRGKMNCTEHAEKHVAEHSSRPHCRYAVVAHLGSKHRHEYVLILQSHFDIAKYGMVQHCPVVHCDVLITHVAQCERIL